MPVKDLYLASLDDAYRILYKQLDDLRDVDVDDMWLTQAEEYTVKGMLAHLIGWSEYAIEVLPLMLASPEPTLPDIDVRAQDTAAIQQRETMTLEAIVAELKAKHKTLVSLVAPLSSEDLTLRRSKKDGRIFTIKSYLLDVMMDHILEHVEELKQWRISQGFDDPARD